MTEKALLLVDDEATILKALQRELLQWARAKGLRILTAGSAEEAEAVIAREAGAVCMLVSDVRMPGRSGPDLIQSVHAAWPDTIALLLTGFAELPRAHQGGAGRRVLLHPEAVGPGVPQGGAGEGARRFSPQDGRGADSRRIDEDLRWAGELQTALFCAPLPAGGRVEFGSVYRPLSEFKCSGD